MFLLLSNSWLKYCVACLVYVIQYSFRVTINSCSTHVFHVYILRYYINTKACYMSLFCKGSTECKQILLCEIALSLCVVIAHSHYTVRLSEHTGWSKWVFQKRRKIFCSVDYSQMSNDGSEIVLKKAWEINLCGICKNMLSSWFLVWIGMGLAAWVLESMIVRMMTTMIMMMMILMVMRLELFIGHLHQCWYPSHRSISEYRCPNKV